MKMHAPQLLFQQQPSHHQKHVYQRLHKKPHADAVAAVLLLGLPQLVLKPVVSAHGLRHPAL